MEGDEVLAIYFNDIDGLMSRPVKFGICNNGHSVYSLLTWVNGEDAEIKLLKLDINSYSQ